MKNKYFAGLGSVLLVLTQFLAFAGSASASCPVGAWGAPPLTDLSPGQYFNGFEGGLYPGWSNTRPAGHTSAGISIANTIQPLNSAGQYDPNGKIVFIPVGISLTNGPWDGFGGPGVGNLPEFYNNSFKGRMENDPSMNPHIALVTTNISAPAPGYNTDPNSQYYVVLNQILANLGYSQLQVEVAWVSPHPVAAGVGGAQPIDQLVPWLTDLWKQELRALKVVYPNLKIVYVGATHKTYQNTVNNFHHDSAWAVKQVVADQINGDMSINYDPAKGTVVAPWITWSNYFWADDNTPRQWDGLVWTCADVFNHIDEQVGGTTPGDWGHPSASGIYKEATQMINFFKSDPTATPWFLGSGVTPTPTPTPTPSTCQNFWNSTLAVPANFGASFNIFSSAQELLMEAFCGSAGAYFQVGNSSPLEFIYKTGYTWNGTAWSPFNYSGSTLSSDGNWIIGQASTAFPSVGITQKQSVLAYICEWNGTMWHCGCHDSACATNYWNLQQFKLK